MNHIIDFDDKNLKFGVPHRKRTWKIISRTLRYLLFVLVLTVAAYGVFAIFFNTDSERRLKSEIRMYEQIYPELEPRSEMIADATALLQMEDNRIYEQVFHADAPAADPMSKLEGFYASDAIPQQELALYTSRKADSLLSVSGRIDAAFAKIFACLQDSSLVLPPMSLPLEDVSYIQVGASVGTKLDPAYNAYVFHEGLDFIVPRGESVIATGDGTVSAVGNSRRFGRTVEITHEGGYKTFYAHLESVRVSRGQRVSRGDAIGRVGMTGKAFAPHLHYELRYGDYTLDPVHYLFGSVSPEEYANILYMGVNTMQSMD